MLRGFYFEVRLIYHRSIEGKFLQSSVNFGPCGRQFNFVRERTAWDTQILNVETDLLKTCSGDVTGIKFFQFRILRVSFDDDRTYVSKSTKAEYVQ